MRAQKQHRARELTQEEGRAATVEVMEAAAAARAAATEEAAVRQEAAAEGLAPRPAAPVCALVQPPAAAPLLRRARLVPEPSLPILRDRPVALS